MHGAIASLDPDTYTGFVHVVTRPCVGCGNTHNFTLEIHKFNDWQAGAHIQKVWPEMSAADREILISGTCDDCFNRMFPPEE